MGLGGVGSPQRFIQPFYACKHHLKLQEEFTPRGCTAEARVKRVMKKPVAGSPNASAIGRLSRLQCLLVCLCCAPLICARTTLSSRDFSLTVAQGEARGTLRHNEGENQPSVFGRQPEYDHGSS